MSNITLAIIVFIIANFVNVILNTIKSLVTIKGGVLSSGLVNAITFGFYTYIVYLIAMADVNIHAKAIIIAVVNFVGVCLVKWFEKKITKDRLWVFMCTCKSDNDTIKSLVKTFEQFNIKARYTEIVKDRLYTLDVYSYTQKDSDVITATLNKYDVKYSAVESKENN